MKLEKIKHLSLNDYGQKTYSNNIILSLKNYRFYMILNDNIAQIKNIYTIKDLFNHLTKNINRYGLSKKDKVNLILNYDSLNIA